jgi:hypothetical protein
MPVIVRDAPHPADAWHRLRIVRTAAGTPEDCTVELVRFEEPRAVGQLLSRESSCGLTLAQCRRLYERVRLDSLEGAVQRLRAARPGPAPVNVSRSEVHRIHRLRVTPAGLEALKFLEREFPGRSGAVDLALQEAARARGWQASSEEGPQAAPARRAR